MRKLRLLATSIVLMLTMPTVVFAANNTDASNYTSQTLSILIPLASLACAFFLIRGGFLYITSSGNPQNLEHAKKTLCNALIGLVIVISASVLSSILTQAFFTPQNSSSATAIALSPIQPVSPQNGLTQVLLDAMTGLLQNIIQSGTKPITSGIISFLTVTPSFLSNSVIFNFWLIMVGIVDSLFAIGIALLGFHIMSASTFGFDEIEFKHLLPRIGGAFLLANTSLILIDWVMSLCNMLIQTVLNATGGIDHAWVLNAFDPSVLSSGPNAGAESALITLIFMLLFMVLAILLLLFYTSRLIVLAVGAVLAPFICLLFVLPGLSDFAKIAMRAYLVTIFTVFIHVVIIQLASSFLTIPGQSGTNSLMSIIVGIATLFTLLKSPAVIFEFAFFSASSGALKKMGGQLMHVISASRAQSNAIDMSGSVTKRRTVAL